MIKRRIVSVSLDDEYIQRLADIAKTFEVERSEMVKIMIDNFSENIITIMEREEHKQMNHLQDIKNKINTLKNQKVLETKKESEIHNAYINKLLNDETVIGILAGCEQYFNGEKDIRFLDNGLKNYKKIMLERNLSTETVAELGLKYYESDNSKQKY